MRTVQVLSLDTMHEAVAEKLLQHYPPNLLQVVTALRFGQVECVQALDKLVDGNCELEAECRQCTSYMVIELGGSPFSKPVNERGVPGRAPEDRSSVDRLVLARELEIGAALINEADEHSWTPDRIVQIASALALSLGDELLSKRILNLHADVFCPAWQYRFRILDGL